MADYDRRLQRLEEIAAAANDSGDLLLELCRKRTAELLASKEVQADPEPDISPEEWATVWAPIQAAGRLEIGKR